jgi:diguanylate cyclase (GGDEF)-like protein
MICASDVLQGKILIVDDKEADVRLLEGMLRRAGYVSISYTMDPGEACELHRNNHYNLILLDLRMPGMDGYAVMEKLGQIDPDSYLPVLALSAHPDNKLRALNAGAKDFVGKPFEHAEVLLRVRNMLEVRLLHDAAREHGKELELLALSDPLTGLANRRLLADRLSRALVHARRNKSTMALVYLDLDGFKQINDTLGHDAGDVLLKRVAARLLAAVREVDTVARLGGDEFILVLWQVSGADHAATAVLRALAAVAQPYDILGQAVSMTACAGVGIFPAHGETADTLMKSADLALYAAKRADKNTYRISERTAPLTETLNSHA